MATKKLVPRANDEGGIGTAAKTWGASWLKNLTITNLQTTTSVSGLIESSGNVEKRNLTTVGIDVQDTEDSTCYVGLWESATGVLLPKTDESLLYDASSEILKVLGTLEMGSSANTNAHVIRRAAVTNQAVGGSLSIYGGDTTGTNSLGGNLNLFTGKGTGTGGGSSAGIVMWNSYQTGSGAGAQSLVKNTLFYSVGVTTGVRQYNPADATDYYDVAVGASGSTTVTTIDNTSNAANLLFDIDGSITLDSATEVHYFKQNGNQQAKIDSTGLTINTIATDASLTSILVEDSGLVKKRPLSGLTMTVADTEATTCFVGLWESATGNLLPKTDEGLTYNAQTGSEVLSIAGDILMGDGTHNDLATIDVKVGNAGIGGNRLVLNAGDSGAGTNLSCGNVQLTTGLGTGTGNNPIIDFVGAKQVASGAGQQATQSMAYFQHFGDGGAASYNHLRIVSPQDGNDLSYIATYADGVTVIKTDDDNAAAAHLVLDSDGDTSFKKTGTTLATVESLRTEHILIACSDESTSLTASVRKVTFRMPYAFTLTDVRLGCNVAPTGAAITVDISDDGTSIFDDGTNNGVRPTIAATAYTSVGGVAHAFAQGGAAATATVALGDDSQMTIDVDVIGSTIAGTGLKVTLIGHKTV